MPFSRNRTNPAKSISSELPVLEYLASSVSSQWPDVDRERPTASRTDAADSTRSPRAFSKQCLANCSSMVSFFGRTLYALIRMALRRRGASRVLEEAPMVEGWRRRTPARL